MHRWCPNPSWAARFRARLLDDDAIPRHAHHCGQTRELLSSPTGTACHSHARQSLLGRAFFGTAKTVASPVDAATATSRWRATSLRASSRCSLTRHSPDHAQVCVILVLILFRRVCLMHNAQSPCYASGILPHLPPSPSHLPSFLCTPHLPSTRTRGSVGERGS